MASLNTTITIEMERRTVIVKIFQPLMREADGE